MADWFGGWSLVLVVDEARFVGERSVVSWTVNCGLRRKKADDRGAKASARMKMGRFRRRKRQVVALKARQRSISGCLLTTQWTRGSQSAQGHERNACFHVGSAALGAAAVGSRSFTPLSTYQPPWRPFAGVPLVGACLLSLWSYWAFWLCVDTLTMRFWTLCRNFGSLVGRAWKVRAGLAAHIASAVSTVWLPPYCLFSDEQLASRPSHVWMEEFKSTCESAASCVSYTGRKNASVVDRPCGNLHVRISSFGRSPVTAILNTTYI